MKFVMFTYVGEQGVTEWEAMSAEERAAYVELHLAWFRAHRPNVVGGEELAPPASGRTIRRRRGLLSTTDGPFVETKELLGGYIELEVEDLEAALAMAAEWPTLGTDGNGVECARRTQARSSASLPAWVLSTPKARFRASFRMSAVSGS